MRERILSIKIVCLIGGLAVLTLSNGLMAMDDDYVHIADYLSKGIAYAGTPFNKP